MSFVKEQNYTPFFTPYVQGISPEYKELQERLIKDYDDTFSGYNKFKTAASQMTALDADSQKRKAILDKVITSFDAAAEAGDYENRMRILQQEIGEFESAYRPIMEQYQKRKSHEEEVAKKVSAGFLSAEHAKEELAVAEALYNETGGVQKDDFGNVINTYSDNYNKALRPKDINAVDVVNKINSLKLSHPNMFSVKSGELRVVDGKIMTLTETDKLIEVRPETLYKMAEAAAQVDPELKAYFDYLGYAKAVLTPIQNKQINAITYVQGKAGFVIPSNTPPENVADLIASGYITEEDYLEMEGRVGLVNGEISTEAPIDVDFINTIISTDTKNRAIADFANYGASYAYLKVDTSITEALKNAKNNSQDGGGKNGVTTPNMATTTLSTSGITKTDTYNTLKNQITSLAEENNVAAKKFASSSNTLLSFIGDVKVRQSFVNGSLGVINKVNDESMTKLEAIYKGIKTEMPADADTPEKREQAIAQNLKDNVEFLNSQGILVKDNKDVETVAISVADIINQRNNIQRNLYSIEANNAFFQKVAEAYNAEVDNTFIENGKYRNDYSAFGGKGKAIDIIESSAEYLAEQFSDLIKLTPKEIKQNKTAATNQILHSIIKTYGTKDGLPAEVLDKIDYALTLGNNTVDKTQLVYTWLRNQTNKYHTGLFETLDKQVKKDPTKINFTVTDYTLVANDGSVFDDLNKLMDNVPINDNTTVVGGGDGATNLKTYLLESGVSSGDFVGEFKRIGKPRLNLTPQFNSITGTYQYAMEYEVSYNPKMPAKTIKTFLTDSNIATDAMVRYYFNLHDKEKGEAPYEANETNRGQIALSYGFYTLEKGANTLISSGKLAQTEKLVVIRSKNGFEYQIVGSGGAKSLQVKGQDGVYRDVMKPGTTSIAMFAVDNLQPMIELIGDIELHYKFRTKHAQQYNEYLQKFSGVNPNLGTTPVTMEDKQILDN